MPRRVLHRRDRSRHSTAQAWVLVGVVEARVLGYLGQVAEPVSGRAAARCLGVRTPEPAPWHRGEATVPVPALVLGEATAPGLVPVPALAEVVAAAPLLVEEAEAAAPPCSGHPARYRHPAWTSCPVPPG